MDIEKFKADYQRWVTESEPEFRPGNDKIFKTYPLLVADDSPWTPYEGDPSQQTFALVTSGGLYLKDSQPPFDTESIHGDVSFRELPKSVQAEDLAIAHAHYDHSLADEDLNIIFPLERLLELEQEKVVGKVADTHYSFSYVNDAATLVNETIPKFLDSLKSQHVDVLFLVPV